MYKTDGKKKLSIELLVELYIDAYWRASTIAKRIEWCCFLWSAVCGAPKRRFRPYQPAVTRNANDKDVRKARKAQIQRDEAIG